MSDVHKFTYKLNIVTVFYILIELSLRFQNCEQTMELLDSESDRANVNKELKSQNKKGIELQVVVL